GACLLHVDAPAIVAVTGLLALLFFMRMTMTGNAVGGFEAGDRRAEHAALMDPCGRRAGAFGAQVAVVEHAVAFVLLLVIVIIVRAGTRGVARNVELAGLASCDVGAELEVADAITRPQRAIAL